MLYRSTRCCSGQVDGAGLLSFEDAVLTGLAPDGGLYVPVSQPTFTLDQIHSWADLAYYELAFNVIRPYILQSASEGGIPDADLKDILKRSFATFSHPDVTPVVPLTDSIKILELFHGPTFAFKDVALQVLGNLFEYFLARKNAALPAGAAPHRITVLGATSGDTGGAAIYGLRNKRNVSVHILHPKNRISPVQEQQMTSVLDRNVHNIAVSGATFDDCQEIVKILFSDAEFKKKHTLAAINSINWARIVAQTTYYFKAYLSLWKSSGRPGHPTPLAFAVPTGNFGDILAGWYAKRMGCPIARLIIATNENDILHRFMETGSYTKPAATATQEPVRMTLSPAMDILVSSNFERVLYHFSMSHHNNSPALAATDITSYMHLLKSSSGFSVPAPVHDLARQSFLSQRVADTETSDAIRRHVKNYVLDPHTAVGVVAAERYLAGFSQGSGPLTPIVVLSTASPGKFPDAVFDAVKGLDGVSLKYEDFAPEPLVRQRGLPKRIVEVMSEGSKEKGVEGVRIVIEAMRGGDLE